jgi:3-methyladenine DNA glycosylase AlkC
VEAFKNIFNSQSVELLANCVKQVWPKFKTESFQKSVIDELSSLEMKDRVRLIAGSLRKYLPQDFQKACSILLKSLKSKENPNGLSGFIVWPLTQFVEDYGLEDFNFSMQALKKMTSRHTSEFAVRPFLRADDKKVFRFFKKWKRDPDEHVRRWVSEGTRPHLPWGMSVPALKDKPERSIDLILDLAYDESEYVRKSVANHLNDISHFDQKLAMEALESIDQGNIEQKRLVKRASRTLLKNNVTRAFKICGYTSAPKVEVVFLKVSPKKLQEGKDLNLELRLTSLKKQKLQISFRISFPRKNQTYSDKIFQLKDVELKKDETISLEKKHSFKKVTTRKHYPGKYLVALRLNGQEVAWGEFQLLKS